MAGVPPCISCLFVARYLGRVLAILPEGISTFFQRLALPAKPFGLLAVYLLGLLVDWLVALLVGWLHDPGTVAGLAKQLDIYIYREREM